MSDMAYELRMKVLLLLLNHSISRITSKKMITDTGYIDHSKAIEPLLDW